LYSKPLWWCPCFCSCLLEDLYFIIVFVRFIHISEVIFCAFIIHICFFNFFLVIDTWNGRSIYTLSYNLLVDEEKNLTFARYLTCWLNLLFLEEKKEKNSNSSIIFRTIIERKKSNFKWLNTIKNRKLRKTRNFCKVIDES